MKATDSQGSRASNTYTIIISASVGVLILAALIAIVAPTSSFACTTDGTILVIDTTTDMSTTTYTNEVPVVQSNTESQQVYGMSPRNISADAAANQPSELTAGMDVSIRWSANLQVNVYVLSAAEFEVYPGTGAPSGSVASTLGASSGLLSFHVSGTDTYWLVIYNPNNGIQGMGAQTVGLFSAAGIATYEGTTTISVAQASSSVTSSSQVSTSTSTTTGTYDHHVNLLSRLQGNMCSA